MDFTSGSVPILMEKDRPALTSRLMATRSYKHKYNYSRILPSSHLPLVVAMGFTPDIPREVLGEIFFFTLRGPISNMRGDKSLFPWHLGRVCKEWRHTFITHPKLWASITLEVRFDATLCSHFLLCLQRSGKQALSLTFYIGKFDQDQRQIWSSIWNASLSRSHRWKSITLYGHDGWEFSNLTLSKENLPLLQQFSMQTSTSGCDWDVFRPVLRLTHLDLHYKAVSYRWSIPWSQLTTFSLAINIISTDTLQDILNNLQDVQALRLYHYNGRWSHDPLYSSPPTCLRHLRVLHVDGPFLPAITAPSLIELRLMAIGSLFNLETVEALLKLSTSRLRKLVLTGSNAAYVKLLANLFHYVEEICIEDYRLLEVFTDKEDFAFPQLRILTLICTAAEYAKKVDAIRRMLELRNGSSVEAPQPSAPLEKIVIQLKHDAPGQIYDYPLYDLAALKNDISRWAPFEVGVQVEQ